MHKCIAARRPADHWRVSAGFFEALQKTSRLASPKLASMNKKRQHAQRIAIAACRVDLGRSAPTELRLVPAGRFFGRDGRPKEVPEGWRMDAASGERVIASARARHDDAVIDYEHQTLNTTANGQPAPAAGWFSPSALEWREDGLYATGVQWTAAACAAIEAAEYRYLSPVISYDPHTGEVRDILMAALTNYAAIDGLDGLTARAAARFQFDNDPADDPEIPEDTVNREQLIQLLGLAADATTESIQASLTALKNQAAAVDELKQ